MLGMVELIWLIERLGYWRWEWVKVHGGDVVFW
jgi:hypothetical protein